LNILFLFLFPPPCSSPSTVYSMSDTSTIPALGMLHLFKLSVLLAGGDMMLRGVKRLPHSAMSR